MESISDIVARGVEQLRGRASGPLHFRLFMMPTVVTLLAVRAGLRDARERRPALLHSILSDAADRRRAFRSATRDILRVFIVALVLDITYQLVVLRGFHVVQLLIVAVGCAIVPYVLVRGPITLVTRRLYRGHAGRPGT